MAKKIGGKGQRVQRAFLVKGSPDVFKKGACKRLLSPLEIRDSNGQPLPDSILIAEGVGKPHARKGQEWRLYKHTKHNLQQKVTDLNLKFIDNIMVEV